MLPYFERLYSVEAAEALWHAAVERFKEAPAITIARSSSPDFLASIRPVFEKRPTLFWLDAHWCIAEGTAGALSQCPLLAELAAITPLENNSVILIDDARYFLAPPPVPHETSQWPHFHDILGALMAMSSGHEIMVVNDVIAFYPARARGCLEQYAKTAGVEWVDTTLHAEVLAKLDVSEADRAARLEVIERLAAEVEQLRAQCAAWLEVIERLGAERAALSTVGGAARHLGKRILANMTSYGRG
jgi:hypothetical protein